MGPQIAPSLVLNVNLGGLARRGLARGGGAVQPPRAS